MKNLVMGALLGAILGTGLYSWAQVDVADLTSHIQANQRISAAAMAGSLTTLAEAHNEATIVRGQAGATPAFGQFCGNSAELHTGDLGGYLGVRQLCGQVPGCNQDMARMCTANEAVVAAQAGVNLGRGGWVSGVHFWSPAPDGRVNQQNDCGGWTVGVDQDESNYFRGTVAAVDAGRLRSLGNQVCGTERQYVMCCD